MKWERLLQRYGIQEEQTGQAVDPFFLLVQQAKAAGIPTAGVTVQTTCGSDFGQVKVVVSVHLNCVQHEGSLNMAGELAFRKALELTNDGARILGIPQLADPGPP